MPGPNESNLPPTPPAPPPAAEKKTMKVKFLVPWSSDRGYFPVTGEKDPPVELPAEIARSLIAEKVAEKA
jgi:hypothetical protein